VAGHAAFPNLEDIERVGQERVEAVEQDIAQPPAEEDPEEGQHHHKVAHLRHGHFELALLRPAPQQQDRRNEAEQVGDSVPAHGQRAAQFEDDRVDIEDIVCHARGLYGAIA